MISIENVGKTYGSGEGSVVALHSVSLTVEAGDFVSVMGESGSGKSTLLSILGALNSPTYGTYKVDGIDIYGLDSERRADFRREYLGFVFQSFHLIPYLTVAENVMLPLTVKPLARSVKRLMAQEALARVGLAGKGDRLPSQVSGGEAERTAIARAIVNHPPVLLADEPTGNLDSSTSWEVMDLISKLNQEGTTVVMVTHSNECAARGRRLVRIRDGSVLEDSRSAPVRAGAPLIQE